MEQGGVPWSILQAAQFPILFVRAFFAGAKRPPWFLPTDFRFQPVDIGQVAAAGAGGGGRPCRALPDLAGPEVLTLGQIARTWLEVRGWRRPTVHLHPRTGSRFPPRWGNVARSSDTGHDLG